jgi:hypothetical protein
MNFLTLQVFILHYLCEVHKLERVKMVGRGGQQWLYTVRVFRLLNYSTDLAKFGIKGSTLNFIG